jgi:long-chain fatty acid transport protein
MKLIHLILCVILCGGWLFGAGFALYEHSAEATGMAGAFTATASDPGALFYNPAGIGFQKRSLYLEATGIAPRSSFRGSGAYPGDGTRENMTNQFFMPANVSFIEPLSDRLTFGIGMFNPFGLGTQWSHPSTFTGRYLSTRADIRGYNLATAIAWRPLDNLSLSVGAHYLAANMDIEQFKGAINPYTQTEVNVGHVRMDADRDGGYGYDAGVLYKFAPSWSTGITYHSAVKIDFDGTAKVTQVSTGYADFDAEVASLLPVGNHPVKLSIKFPAMAFWGLSKSFGENLRVEFNLGWTGWSVYRHLDILAQDDPALSSTRATGWKDTWTFRLGGEYKLAGGAALRAGLVYDRTPQPTWEMSPILADADREGITLGYGVPIGSSMKFDAGYMYLKFKDRSTVSAAHPQMDGYDGYYKSHANLLGMSLTVNF